jgi:hypothetical protein
MQDIIEIRGMSEDMFLAWFFNLPDSANVADAARSEIARIDRAASPSGEVARFRSLLHQATLNQPAASRQRRRQRH